MRKIGAHYILLPGYPLVKYGYLLLSEGLVVEVVDNGGVMKEIQGLEFYGGMMVDGGVMASLAKLHPGDPFLPLLEEFYQQQEKEDGGVVLIEGADLTKFVFLQGTTVRKLL